MNCRNLTTTAPLVCERPFASWFPFGSSSAIVLAKHLLACAIILLFSATPVLAEKLSALIPSAWVTEGPLNFPVVSDPNSVHLAYKNPTVVQVGNRWYVAASRVRYENEKTRHSLVFFSFDDWRHTAGAKVVPLLTDQKYASAPFLFFFTPHNKWYLFYGAEDPKTRIHGPAFSTFNDINRPEDLTAPQMCFPALPESLPQKTGVRWLDFTVIGDEQNMHLFFTDDAGHFMRSSTSREAFPFGWSDPVVLLTQPTSVIFEGSATYRVKSGGFLTIFEGIAESSGDRFYTAFEADEIDGDWRPIVTAPERPFAGIANVRTADGSTPWSPHISHGELLRASHDESVLLDPKNLRLLYQGWDKTSRVPGVPLGRYNGYHEIPWRLSILRATD